MSEFAALLVAVVALVAVILYVRHEIAKEEDAFTGGSGRRDEENQVEK